MRRLLLAVLLLYSFALFSQEEPRQNRVLFVVAQVKDLDANHYLWAAEMAASRLDGSHNEVLEGGLAAALKEARTNPGAIQGIVEIFIDVHSWQEEVRITCYDTGGRDLWKKRTRVNAGGNEEKLARNMFERVLKKIEKEPACGSGR